MLEEACRRQGGEPTSAEIARELKGNRSLSEINARIAALSRGLASSDVQREVRLLEEHADCIPECMLIASLIRATSDVQREVRLLEELAVAGLRLHADCIPECMLIASLIR